MKIECHCGALIVDQTDALPHKAYVVPDQDWHNLFDDLDHLIDKLAGKQFTTEEAYCKLRERIAQSSRQVWQCRECGRLYLENQQRQLQSFLPADATLSKEILRGRTTL